MSGKICKIGHCIDQGITFWMHHIVLSCNRCKAQATYDKLLAIYEGDVRNEQGEVFHHYYFPQFPTCLTCGAVFMGINIVCDPAQDGDKNWEKATAKKVMPHGFCPN